MLLNVSMIVATGPKTLDKLRACLYAELKLKCCVLIL